MSAWCYFDYESYIKRPYEPNVCFKTLGDKSMPCFPCEYEISVNGEIKVKIEDYDFSYELEENKDGAISFHSLSQYERRDILIFDNDKSFLLKKARVSRQSTTSMSSIFSASEYFISDNSAMSSANGLFKLFSKTKVKSIKIFAETFNEFKFQWITKSNREIIYECISTPGVEYKALKDMRNSQKRSVDINKNNISKISMQIDNSPDSPNKSSVYTQIDLKEAADSSEVYGYLTEIIVYFQLFSPSRIKIDRVYTILEDVDQEMDTIIDDIRHETKIIEDDNCFEFVTTHLNDLYLQYFFYKSVLIKGPEKDILNFLKKCYCKIAYRTCDNYMRNIWYFIFEPTTLFIENSFLCCFKFIEKFYRNLSNRREIIKKAIEEYDGDQNKEDIFLYCFKFTEKYYEDLKNNYKLIKRAIEEYYCEKDNESYGHKIIEKMREKYDDYADYIVKLRNHYVHEGYHLPKSGKLKEISLPDVYNDFLRLLQRIAINIIFKSILGYESHEFPMLDEAYFY